MTFTLLRKIIAVAAPLRTPAQTAAIELYETIRTRDLLSVIPAQVLSLRDEIFSGLPAEMTDQDRFEVVRSLATRLYAEIDPEDAYTRITDANHSNAVWGLLLKMEPGADIALQVAALFHDLERFIPEVKTPYLKSDTDVEAFKVVDEKVRKLAIHPENSARLLGILLDGAPLTEAEKQKALFLVRHHDAARKEIKVADRILLPGVGPDDDYYGDLGALADADAAIFFDVTVKIFVEDRVPKEGRAKIAERINMNFMRIQPQNREAVWALIERKWGADEDLISIIREGIESRGDAYGSPRKAST